MHVAAARPLFPESYDPLWQKYLPVGMDVELPCVELHHVLVVRQVLPDHVAAAIPVDGTLYLRIGKITFSQILMLVDESMIGGDDHVGTVHVANLLHQLNEETNLFARSLDHLLLRGLVI